MPRPCSICVHEKRRAIDKALIAGDPYRRIAARFGVTTQALRRHRDNHIAELVAQAAEQKQGEDLAYGGTLTEGVERLRRESAEICGEARSGQDFQTALKAIATQGRLIELQARLCRQLEDGSQINILINPQWIQIQAAVTQALAPYPEASQAVVAALEALGGEVRVGR